MEFSVRANTRSLSSVSSTCLLFLRPRTRSAAQTSRHTPNAQNTPGALRYARRSCAVGWSAVSTALRIAHSVISHPILQTYSTTRKGLASWLFSIVSFMRPSISSWRLLSASDGSCVRNSRPFGSVLCLFSVRSVAKTGFMTESPSLLFSTSYHAPATL